MTNNSLTVHNSSDKENNKNSESISNSVNVTAPSPPTAGDGSSSPQTCNTAATAAKSELQHKVGVSKAAAPTVEEDEAAESAEELSSAVGSWNSPALTRSPPHSASASPRANNDNDDEGEEKVDHSQITTSNNNEAGDVLRAADANSTSTANDTSTATTTQKPNRTSLLSIIAKTNPDGVICNWSGIKTIATTRQIITPHTEEEVSRLIRDPSTRLVRIVGSGMSYEQVFSTDSLDEEEKKEQNKRDDDEGREKQSENTKKNTNNNAAAPRRDIVFDMCNFAGLIEMRPNTAVFGASTSINDIIAILGEHGRMLPASPGVIGIQTLAGALATGTHGQGMRQSCYGDCVESIRIVLPSGSIAFLARDASKSRIVDRMSSSSSSASHLNFSSLPPPSSADRLLPTSATEKNPLSPSSSQPNNSNNICDNTNNTSTDTNATASASPSVTAEDDYYDEPLPPLEVAMAALGTLGVLLEVEITHAPRRVFTCRKFMCDYETFLAQYEQWNAKVEFVKAWWFPETSKCHVWLVDEASERERELFLSAETNPTGELVSISSTDESLNNTVNHYLEALYRDTGVTLADQKEGQQHSLTLHRFADSTDVIGYLQQIVCKGIPVPQINCEIAVPMSKFKKATELLHQWSAEHVGKLHYPFIYRATGESTTPFFPSYQRREGIAYIGFLVYLAADGSVRDDGMKTMEALQQLLAGNGLEGLPHMGKHFLPRVYDYSANPGLGSVVSWSRRLDPNGKFLNTFLREIWSCIERPSGSE